MEDLTSPRILRETLARYGLAPRKNLGQNFLIDGNLRDKIVQVASPGPDDLAVEVGPGPGGLTFGLLATGARVLAIETDRGLARILTDSAATAEGRLAVIIQDFLALDLAGAVSAAGWSGRPAIGVANLPYYITTPAIFHLLDSGLPWRRLVLLMQREVAERITARPGTKDYGLLSVMVQYRAGTEMLNHFPPSVFWPPPKVQSALVRLAFPGPYTVPEPVDRLFKGMARAAFNQRRKTLHNACREFLAREGLEEAFLAACRESGVDPGARGEQLSVAQFVGLAEKMAP